ncbi:MAG TPA: ABC transporter substrate-binding protein [Stellaceae bacterium]|nr:ABC transporter substrate-binding protein [Stellaceae bacterium]
MRFLAAAGLALALTIAGTTQGRANDFIRIGVVYSFTGPSKKSGLDAAAAIEIAADIVNKPHKGLEALPLGAGQGLPNLGNDLIQVIAADHQDNPSVAQSQVLRLIGQNQVVALIGAGEGAATLAATAAAEHHGVPFLAPDATEPKITGRGFKWVFRTTPLASDLTKAYMQFLTAQKAGGTKVDTIALVFEKTARGASTEAALRDAAKAAGIDIVTEIGYAPDGIDLSAQVKELRNKNPDVAIFISDGADASLFIKTMKSIDYKPPILIGDDDGFSDPGFVAADGNLAQGLIDRSVWSVGDADSPSAIVNGLYKAKTGHDLDDTSARVLQGFLVLAAAINRAGSTDPAAIQKALRETDLKPDQLIVGYDGVKFDASGQNTLAGTYLTQLRGKQYVTVWPPERTAGKLVLPYKAWQQ